MTRLVEKNIFAKTLMDKEMSVEEKSGIEKKSSERFTKPCCKILSIIFTLEILHYIFKQTKVCLKKVPQGLLSFARLHKKIAEIIFFSEFHFVTLDMDY